MKKYGAAFRQDAIVQKTTFLPPRAPPAIKKIMRRFIGNVACAG
jgi:hypothetical protein